MPTPSDLPFQWDDGHFISPFVATREEDVEIACEWLVSHVIAPKVHEGTSHGPSMSTATLLRVTDWGCGDGTALLFFVKHLVAKWLSSDLAKAVELRVKATGVDLDEDLIATAGIHCSPPVAAAVPELVEWRWVCEDIRHCNLNDFNRRQAEPLPHILFLYLLPDALEMLKDRINELLLRRGCVVLSNRWPVRYLEPWLVANVGNVHVYRYTEPI